MYNWLLHNHGITNDSMRYIENSDDFSEILLVVFLGMGRQQCYGYGDLCCLPSNLRHRHLLGMLRRSTST